MMPARVGGKGLCKLYPVGVRGNAVSNNVKRPLVLVIEDDVAISEIVKRALEEHGYSVHTAANGREGLEEFFLLMPDLIILDMKMPVMNGWETLGRLRQISDCPVLILTCLSDTADVVSGLELGADDYLVKPFGIQELIARVNKVLRRANTIPASRMARSGNHALAVEVEKDET